MRDEHLKAEVDGVDLTAARAKVRAVDAIVMDVCVDRVRSPKTTNRAVEKVASKNCLQKRQEEDLFERTEVNWRKDDVQMDGRNSQRMSGN